VNREEYRAHPALNYSAAKWLLESPADYKCRVDQPIEQTHAMLLGTLAHSVILEGKTLLEIASIKPAGLNLSTKEGKSWKAEQTLPIISADDAEAIQGMTAGVMANPHARQLLDGAQHREIPLLAEIQGVQCKGLVDAAGTNGKDWAILDLKTTADPSPREFRWSAIKNRYALQAAWYRALLGRHHDLEDPPQWYWIAVGKSAPWTAVVYTLPVEWEMTGETDLERVLETYKQCQSSGQWPRPHQESILVLEP
jgi:hypothetical protein